MMSSRSTRVNACSEGGTDRPAAHKLPAVLQWSKAAHGAAIADLELQSNLQPLQY